MQTLTPPTGPRPRKRGATQPAVIYPAGGRALSMELLRAREAVMQRMRPLLLGHDITEQQWRVMRVLGAYGTMDIAHISRRCLIQHASLSRMLPRLESGGLIARSTHAADQRKTNVMLTPMGMKLFNAVSRKIEALYARIAGEVGEDRLRSLYHLLDEVRDLLAAGV